MAVKPDGGFVQLPQEVMNLLLSLAWGADAIDFDSLKVVHLSGAMTNLIYRVSWPSHIPNVSRTVLLRIYGEGLDVFFDRSQEIRTFESLSKLGYGPKLLAQFPKGRIEEFIHARTLSAADLRDAGISARIAAKMREFHCLDMPGPKEVLLWNRMRKWVGEAMRLCSTEVAKEHNLDRLDKEIVLLEKSMSMKHQDVGFCHNDLQYGNIMMHDEDGTITIIDYEYASYNPVAYDIANHFCEMAADYHTDTPHVLDYSKYPGPEERGRFIEQYLVSSGEEEASEALIDQMLNDVEKYALASHIFWGLWGIISAHVNNIDFDYISYAKQRLEQYWLMKPLVLNQQGKNSNGFSGTRVFES